MVKSFIQNPPYSTMVVIAAVSLLLLIVSTSLRLVHAQNPVGTLRVITRVINDNGGTKEASDFTNCINSSRGDSTSMQCSSGDPDGNTQSSFDPGPYKVTQQNPPIEGYTVTYSKDCSGSINAGESKACTITYDDVASPPSNQTTPNK
jgi:Prealbumin-like fold domain